MKMRLALCILGVLVLACGCAQGLKQEAPSKRLYVLELPGPESVPALSDKGLALRRVRIAPPYDTVSLTYRTKGSEFQSDYYHQFLSPPAEMATAAVRSWLSASNAFAYVTEPVGGAGYAYVMEMLITELYGDFDRASPKAVVAAQIFVLDAATGARRVLHHAETRELVDLAEPSPAALVEGLNQGLGSILARTVQDLQGKLE